MLSFSYVRMHVSTSIHHSMLFFFCALCIVCIVRFVAVLSHFFLRIFMLVAWTFKCALNFFFSSYIIYVYTFTPLTKSNHFVFDFIVLSYVLFGWLDSILLEYFHLLLFDFKHFQDDIISTCNIHIYDVKPA